MQKKSIYKKEDNTFQDASIRYDEFVDVISQVIFFINHPDFEMFVCVCVCIIYSLPRKIY